MEHGKAGGGGRWLVAWGLGALLAAGLAGCAVAPPAVAPVPGQRHSPAEIAAYRPAQFSWPLASAEGLAKARAEAMADIDRAEAGGADDETIARAARAVAMWNTRIDAGQRIVRGVLVDTGRPLPQRSTDFQRALLTAAFTFDAEASAPLIAPMLDQLATPRQFAIAAYTLRRADAGAAARAQIRAALARRSDPTEPRLVALARALDADEAGAPPQRPPLAELLAAPLKPGVPVVFSVQRRDRRQMGLALVRDVDGRFVREADGRPFSVPQLALALSGLPGMITLGNTPQGLFTVTGSSTAENPWIGPTPFLESKVPVEARLAEFSHGAADGEWSEGAYEAWLPPSWRGFAPMKEAWLAGLAGRDEMLLHGTAMTPAPYLGRSHYPGTPTDGCLTTNEVWSPEGRLQRSDQLALARAFTRSGVDRGFLVVVEIDDQPRAVSLDELLPEIRAAEGRAR